jgi:hypothetical protein
MTDTRIPYQSPQCRCLGTVQELTRESNLNNADTPAGNANSAFPEQS